MHSVRRKATVGNSHSLQQSGPGLSKLGGDTAKTKAQVLE
jgi:hypothetical protein